MNNKIITTAIGAVLLSGVAMNGSAEPGLLDREASIAAFTGSTGTHYYLPHRKHYKFNWSQNGELTVTNLKPKEKEEPLATGKWHIKSVEKKKDMTDEEVAAQNAALQFVYCHHLDNMWGDNEMCWEAHRVSHDLTSDKKDAQLKKTQEYKLYREAGAETGAYIITQR